MKAFFIHIVIDRWETIVRYPQTSPLRLIVFYIMYVASNNCITVLCVVLLTTDYKSVTRTACLCHRIHFVTYDKVLRVIKMSQQWKFVRVGGPQKHNIGYQR